MAGDPDYYADLELPPTAELTEIKKQYRKLALRYHPDRNPGREDEVKSKFVVIQAAYDALTDPKEKARYDAVRKSTSSRYPTASGKKGNPWSHVSEQFPTPPRRQNPSARGPTSGADRWNQRFSSGVPPTARTSAGMNQGAETKKNAASAFEKMRNKTQTSAKGPPPPTPPRAEYAKQRAEASFGASRSSRANRASAYQPSASTSGDEPSVSGSNYAPRRNSQGAYSRYQDQKPQDIPMPDPLSQFRDANMSDPRKSSPYTTHGGEKTNPFDGTNLGRSKSTREAAGYATYDSDDVPLPNAGRPRSTTDTNNSYVNPDESANTNGKGQSQNHSPYQHEAPNTSKPSTEASGAPTKKPSIFNLSNNEPRSSARSSTDDINTSFVNGSGPDKWEFSAGGHNQPEPVQTETQQNRDASQSGQPTYAEQPAGAAKGPADRHGATDQGFHAEGWGGKFGPETFVPPAASASPSKPVRTNTKKSKATKPANGDNVIVIDDSSDDETFTWRGRKSQPTNPVTDSPQAMDIDSPRPETSPPAPTDEPRNIPLEPSRPEWRSGDPAESSKFPPTAAPVAANKYANAGGSEDSDEFKASLADLRKTSPISYEHSGLKSFGEMKDNLPFESKAGGNVPLNGMPKPQPLAFPAAPQGPRLPPTVAVSGIQPNAASWEKYLAEFEKYMHEWDQFHGQVTDHFAARTSSIADARASKGYGFLRQSEGDCLDYINTVRQDNDVRRRWNTECEEHEARLREFLTFREKMKQMDG